MVGFKLAVVLMVIVAGGLHVSPAHWTPFLPLNTGEFGHFGCQRRFSRRGGGVFRLYRFRRRLDRGAGGA